MFDGKDFDAQCVVHGEVRALRRRMQIVFQDPYGRSKPAHDGARDVGQGRDHRLADGGKKPTNSYAAVLEKVGLDPS